MLKHQGTASGEIMRNFFSIFFTILIECKQGKGDRFFPDLEPYPSPLESLTPLWASMPYHDHWY